MSDLVAKIRTAIGDPGSVVPRNGDDETVARWATRAVLHRLEITMLLAEAHMEAVGAIAEILGEGYSSDGSLVEDIAFLAEQRDEARAELAAAERARDLAIAHDRQAYPTADAYERACRALAKHRARAEQAEVEVARLAARPECTALCGDVEADRDRLAARLTEAEAVIVAAQQELSPDHPVWRTLDGYDGSMDAVRDLVAERDAAEKLADQAQAELAAARLADGVTVTEYRVSLLPLDHIDSHLFSIQVQWRGLGRWAAVRMRNCLANDGSGWDFEAQPSSREDDWLDRYRFDTAEAAIATAVAAAPHVTCNGITAAQVLGEDGGAQ